MNLLVIIGTGLAATLVMTLFMGLINGLGLANADMVRAIGSIYTGSIKNAFWPGIFIKFTGGAVFSVIYALIGGIAPVHTPTSVIVVMTFIGIFHGLAVSVLMFIAVAEHHPLPEFQKAGGEVILSHLAGHIVYGFSVGMLFVLLHANLHLIDFGAPVM